MDKARVAALASATAAATVMGWLGRTRANTLVICCYDG